MIINNNKDLVTNKKVEKIIIYVTYLVFLSVELIEAVPDAFKT